MARHKMGKCKLNKQEIKMIKKMVDDYQLSCIHTLRGLIDSVAVISKDWNDLKTMRAGYLLETYWNKATKSGGVHIDFY